MLFPCDVELGVKKKKSFTLTYDDGEKRLTIKCSGCGFFEAAEYLYDRVEDMERVERRGK